MNSMPVWKYRIISWLVGGKPLLMNFTYFANNLPLGVASVYFPHEKISKEEAGKRGVLVPSICIKEEENEESINNK